MEVGAGLTLIQITVVAIVQGLTEYLPISSWGHLVLLQKAGGWPDQGLVIEVAVHVGSLGAVVVYFWRDIWSVLVGLAQLVRGRRSPGAKLVVTYLISNK